MVRLLPLLLLLACGADEPVLTGVAPTAPVTAEAAAADAPAGEATSAPVAADGAYAPAEGVYVDVRYLGGKRYKEVADVVALQLGPLVQAEELPGDAGRAMVFERGQIRIYEDRVVMLDIPLPNLMRRTAALAALGFPPATGRYLTLHREYRLNHEWGFRRIRMMRENRASELINRVEAWHRVPGENDERR